MAKRIGEPDVCLITREKLEEMKTDAAWSMPDVNNPETYQGVPLEIVNTADDLTRRTAELLAEKKTVEWIQ